MAIFALTEKLEISRLLWLTCLLDQHNIHRDQLFIFRSNLATILLQHARIPAQCAFS